MPDLIILETRGLVMLMKYRTEMMFMDGALKLMMVH